MIKRRKFKRRLYENTLLVAVRQRRILCAFWARRCRKSTNLGSIAFDEMSGEAGRSVIAASASLLLGKELVGMTTTASEQAALVYNEATAYRRVFEHGSEERNMEFKAANAESGRVYENMTPEDFADLYRTSSMEMRLYHDRTTYSRLKIIAPNPATARGWAGTVLRDEAGYTPAGLENDLRVATKPIMDTDPTFKLIYASNLCPDDRHPYFEMTLPPVDHELPVNPSGNFYRGQTGVLIHRVTLADAYAAGHQLYDEKGKALTYEEFCKQPGNKLGLAINYKLEHESGGSAAVDLLALLVAQKRGVRDCAFVWIEDEHDLMRAVELLQDLLGTGSVGIGFDVATTTKEKSNPSSVTITEQVGVERKQRLVCLWKERLPQVVWHRLETLIGGIERRKEGGPARRLCIDATNERLFAEATKDRLAGRIPVELVVSSVALHPPGYEKPVNYKTYLGDIYAAALNENRYSLPSSEYLKQDHLLVVKDSGTYACVPDSDGKHGDTFDSGKLAEYALAPRTGEIGITTLSLEESYEYYTPTRRRRVLL